MSNWHTNKFNICQIGILLLNYSDNMVIVLLKDMNMNLFEVRTQYGLSQLKAASILNVPLRTYIRYEQDNSYGDNLKRDMMIRVLNEQCEITETKGLLSIEYIRSALKELFDKEYPNQIEFCYLFGSYAKGYVKENSDVDLYVSTKLTGLKFVGLSEAIRNVLHKKIDLVRFSSLNNNIELINEIMKDGIKIYR